MAEDRWGKFQKPLRVLVVEDNQVDQRILSAMLKEVSRNINSLKIADSFGKAIKLLDDNEFDVIVLDLNLPDSQGRETLVRLHERDPQMAVVVNTGAYEDDLGLESLHLGAQDFLVKGKYTAYILNKVLQYAVERKHLENELKNTYEQLKETQAQLLQAEKMRVVGNLASGVAHEVKNPLATILYGITYLKDRVKVNDDKYTLVINNIKEATEKANEIITGLLDFSSLARLNKRQENLNAVVEKALSLIQHQLNKNHVEVFRNFEKDVMKVSIDRNRIEQVLVNLLLNAVYAMPKGGEIQIKIFSQTIPKNAALKWGGLKTGQNVLVLTVDDEGSGIMEQDLDKVFDPFFTTRRANGGVGLGLSVSRSIMEYHEGLIVLANRKKGGVKATLVFKA